MPTLVNFESEADMTSFIRCKIESLVQVVSDQITENMSLSGRAQELLDANSTPSKFTKLFGMPAEEKLVNCRLKNLRLFLSISKTHLFWL